MLRINFFFLSAVQGKFKEWHDPQVPISKATVAWTGQRSTLQTVGLVSMSHHQKGLIVQGMDCAAARLQQLQMAPQCTASITSLLSKILQSASRRAALDKFSHSRMSASGGSSSSAVDQVMLLAD